MIKITKHTKYCTIPIHFLEDESLSLEAKGFLALLFAKEYTSFDDILNYTTKEQITNVINELTSKGYIEIKENDYIVNYKSSKTKQSNTILEASEIKTNKEVEAEGEVVKKLNLYEKCMNAVDEFTTDEKLREILKQYLELRLNPSKDSRLANKKIAHLNQWKAQLETLNVLAGNNVDIVNQSIQNAWAKFVAIDQNVVERAPVFHNRYTEEEIKAIRERANKFEKGSF